MSVYRIQFRNGNFINVDAKKHEKTDKGLFVLYGKDGEVVSEFNISDVMSWQRLEKKEVQISAL